MSIDDPLNARSRRTRVALLTAAREILEGQGFEGLTMAAVAERAGVTRRAVYLHVTSRADLVSALFDHVIESEGLSESIQQVWDAPNAIAALDEFARHQVRYHLRVLAISQAVQRVRRTDEDAARHWERIVQTQRENCGRLADRLVNDVVLTDSWTSETATDMLWALISDEVIERLLIDRHWPHEQFTEHFAQLLKGTFVQDSSSND